MAPGEAARRSSEASRLEAVFDRYAENPRRQRAWAASNPGNVAIRHELLGAIFEFAAAPLAGDGLVLDVGCGSGWLLAELAAHGVATERLHGVDLIERRITTAEQRVPGASLRRADARTLPFPDDSFELVLLLTALSSMPSEEAVASALAETARVVSRTGLILCYEPRLPNPFNRSTQAIDEAQMAALLGPAVARRSLTGLPPLARRLGRSTRRLYPVVSRLVPTHRLTVHSPASALRRRG